METATPAPRPSRAVVVAVAAETGLALVLALVRLKSRSFWQDEGFTWSTVDRSLPALFDVIVRQEGFQILHSLLLWPVNGLWSTVVGLRFPSVLAYAGTVPAVWLLGRRLYGDAAGLVAGLLLALNAFALQYGQEARSYALAMMLTAFAGAALVRYVEAPDRAVRARWIALSALSVYAHGFAVLAVGAQVLSLALLPRAQARQVRWLRSGLWIAAWAAPAIVLPALQIGSGDVGWIGEPGLEALVGMVWTTAGRTITTVAPYGMAIGVALLAARREAGGVLRSPPGWRVVFLCAWVALPPLVLWCASYVSPIWLERYAIWSLGAVVVLVARGITLIGSRRLQAIVVVAVALLAARGVLRWYGRPSLEDYDAAVAFVAADVRPGDAILFSPDEARIPFEFYSRSTSMPRDVTPVFPADDWRDFKTGDHRVESADLDSFLRAKDYDRVWLVLFDDPAVVYPRANLLLVDHRVVQHRAFKGTIEILLYERE